AGDDVAGDGRGAADDVVGGPAGDEDAGACVGQGGGAGGVGADQVALDHVAAGAGAPDQHAGQVVAGGDVAGAGAGRGRDPTDGVVRSPEVEADAGGPLVGQGGGAADVGADEVAGDGVMVRAAGAVDQDAVLLVAGDEVAGRGRGAADRVARG